jgi:hypothetical protein
MTAAATSNKPIPAREERSGVGELEDLRRENEKLRFMVDTAIRTCKTWAEDKRTPRDLASGGIGLLRHLEAIERGTGRTDVARKL